MKCSLSLIFLIFAFLGCKQENNSVHNKFIPFSNQNPIKEIPIIKKKIRKEKDSLKKADEYFELGKEFHKLNIEDKAFHYYKISQDIYEQLDNNHQYDVGYYMHRILESKNGAVIDTSRVYLKNFYQYANESDSKVRLALAYKEYGDLAIIAGDNPKAKIFYKKALIYANQSDSLELPALFNSNYGYATENNDSLKFYYHKSLSLSKQLNYKEGIFKVYNNLGSYFKNENNADSSLYYYKKADQIKLNNFSQVQYSILYSNLKELYGLEKNNDLYTKFSIKYDSIEKIIKLNKQIANIAAVEINSNKKEISSLKEISANYQKYKILYFFLIAIVFLIAMYSVIRWKKVDYRRRKLTEENESLHVEHIQTIQELEKVKQLVIEDHIILKNKAKIYLNELLYIKSEDHYLLLFTLKKKEFVRGKISEIIGELPPNFVQTHRSYIINKNCIVSNNSTSVILEGKIEIPLSRNFKKNID